MGVKFRTGTRFREASTFPFCIHIVFLVLSEPLYLLVLHDIFVFITYAHRSVRHDIFVFTTYAHRSARHDSFDCTAMPFF
jgi:hypothetical protein